MYYMVSASRHGKSYNDSRFTGGRQSSLAISVFLIDPACSRVIPLTLSVMYDDEAIADPQPNVLNLTSEMTPLSSTRIWSFMTLLIGIRTRCWTIGSVALTLHMLHSISQRSSLFLIANYTPGAPTNPVPTSTSALGMFPTYQYKSISKIVSLDPAPILISRKNSNDIHFEGSHSGRSPAKSSQPYSRETLRVCFITYVHTFSW